MSKGSFCINSCATEDYLPLLSNFYTSLRNFHNDIFFVIYLINCPKINCFQNLNDDRLIIHYIEKQFDNKEQARAFAVNIRIEMLKDAWGKYDYFYWMDADTIIRKPIDDLHKFDNIRIMSRKHKNINMRYVGGICGFRSSEIAKYVIWNWYNDVFKLDYKNWSWWMDQRLLGVYVDKLNKTDWSELPATYTDWDFNANSHIWNGKGPRKKKEKFKNFIINNATD